MTRQMRTTVANAELPALPEGVRAKAVLLTETADTVLVGTEDGTVFRYDSRDFRNPRMVERAAVLSDGEMLTGLYYLVGEQSLVVTGSRGTTDVFFLLERRNARGSDGFELVRAHRLENQGAPIGYVSASPRSKMFVTADASGGVWVRHSTSSRTLLKLQKTVDAASGYSGLVMAPREDGVIALTAQGRQPRGGFRRRIPRRRWPPCSGVSGTKAIPSRPSPGSQAPDRTASNRSSAWCL